MLERFPRLLHFPHRQDWHLNPQKQNRKTWKNDHNGTITVLLERFFSMLAGMWYFGGWVANDNDDDNGDDGGGGTKLLATAGSLQSSSLQSWHGDHFKETGGPCWLRWAFYNVRVDTDLAQEQRKSRTRRTGWQQQCSFPLGKKRGREI